MELKANFEVPDELKDQIKRQILKEVMKEIETLKEDQIMSVKEFAQFIGVSPATAYYVIKNDNVPCRMIGNKKRLLKSEVINWFKSSKYHTATEFQGIKKSES